MRTRWNPLQEFPVSRGEDSHLQVTHRSTNHVSTRLARPRWPLLCERPGRRHEHPSPGATLTYINEYLRKHLEQRNIQPHPNKRNVQLADQTCVASTHSYPVQIKYNGQATNTLVAVIPNLAEKMILGMDFLAKRGIVVSLDNQPLAPAPPPRLDTTHALCSLIERAHLNEEQNKTLADFFGNSQRAILQNHRAQHRRRTRDHTPASSPTKTTLSPTQPCHAAGDKRRSGRAPRGGKDRTIQKRIQLPHRLSSAKARKLAHVYRLPPAQCRQRTRRMPVTPGKGGKIYLHDRPQKWVAASPCQRAQSTRRQQPPTPPSQPRQPQTQPRRSPPNQGSPKHHPKRTRPQRTTKRPPGTHSTHSKSCG
ncbi:PREDICTED: uncharacterized protein LOC108356946 [Rhagoletis zephyria]|uniref:uncharacterized protein LOC108356946 n=1 Tax=Rhagoletis zephyria TaxID=28612 RepID=UPI0008118C87|nr:PREDICTED: uncharacterized protein LOC108356946 [Rhagoletis zephyria]